MMLVQTERLNQLLDKLWAIGCLRVQVHTNFIAVHPGMTFYADTIEQVRDAVCSVAHTRPSLEFKNQWLVSELSVRIHLLPLGAYIRGQPIDFNSEHYQAAALESRMLGGTRAQFYCPHGGMTITHNYQKPSSPTSPERPPPAVVHHVACTEGCFAFLKVPGVPTLVEPF